MGNKTNRRLIYIVVCLLVAANFIYFVPSAEIHDIKNPLSSVFENINGWKNVHDTVIQQNFVTALDLDDYLFRNYSKDHQVVSLYVGYYRSTLKVGAAHSPLVCFPGQGWEISAPVKVDAESESGKIKAEKLIVKKGQQHELLLYWFQSYDRTSRGTFMQKVNNFWARLNSKPEDNAFVRVSVPIRENNTEGALDNAVEFVQDFYPHFLRYIKN